MVRDLKYSEFRTLNAKRSDFSVIEELRYEGELICKTYNKKPLIPEQSDINWFFSDLEIIYPGSLKDKKTFILETRPDLIDYYNIYQTIWAWGFYQYIVEALWDKKENTGMIDFIYFFSILYPFPKIPSMPFCSLIYTLRPLQLEIKREELLTKILTKDPEALYQLLNNGTIPHEYSQVFDFQTLKSRVKQRCPGLIDLLKTRQSI